MKLEAGNLWQFPTMRPSEAKENIYAVPNVAMSVAPGLAIALCNISKLLLAFVMTSSALSELNAVE